MLNPQAELDSVVNNPKLDQLLAQAREHTNKLAQVAGVTVPTEAAVAAINAEVQNVTEKVAEAQAQLRQVLDKRAADRAEKVAIAVHMLRVGTALAAE